ncbi:tRNA(m(1)G37)methyltransferase [Saitoella coloradoensis]
MLLRPPVFRGMKLLDRSVFKKAVDLAAMKVDPKNLGLIRKECAQDLLRLPRIAPIVKHDNGKVILFKLGVTPEDLSPLQQKTRELIAKNNAEIIPYKFEVDYSFWTVDDILSSVLPEDLLGETPGGYTAVGHIAHLNLREQYLPYKYLIGQVILDKNPSLRTVVNKLDSIDTVYRNFKMEVLAGDDDFWVEQSESGCRFQFDFSKVYWNTRLHTEHDRLISLFQRGEAVCDVMAGVGPFAVPAGKNGVIVLANDLNPDSYKAMVNNISLNKIAYTKAYNMDGRAFIHHAAAELEELAQGPPIENPFKKRSRTKPRQPVEVVSIPPTFQHYVMNLPASALEFLDAFKGVYHNRSHLFKPHTTAELPMIHVYCFTKEDPPTQDLLGRIKEALGWELKEEEVSMHYVRKVAPMKDMYCCSFRLPAEVAFAPKDAQYVDIIPPPAPATTITAGQAISTGAESTEEMPHPPKRSMV